MLSIWQISFGSRSDFIGKCDIIYIVFLLLLWSMYGIFFLDINLFFYFSFPYVEKLDLLSYGLALQCIKFVGRLVCR